MLGRGERKQQCKRRAPPHLAAHLKFAAHGMREFAADRQSEADAAFLMLLQWRCELDERFEDALLLVLGNARPGIRYFNRSPRSRLSGASTMPTAT